MLGDSIPWYDEGTLFNGAPTIQGTSARVPILWPTGRHSYVNFELETALANVCVLGTRRAPDRNLGIVSTLFGASVAALAAAFTVAMASSDIRDPAAVRGLVTGGGVAAGVGAVFVGVGLWHLVAAGQDAMQIHGACPAR